LLNINDKNNGKWDIVTLGELLLRFDPGDARLWEADTFRVHDGGAEYNVAANLSKVFGMNAAFVSAVHDNLIGKLALGLARRSGVDTRFVKTTDEGRNGIYFIERGSGPRAARSAFDRDKSAVSAVGGDTFAFDEIFSEGVRWFHTGGVFAGLSDTTPDAALAAMKAARDANAVVSYDLNYRDSLWRKRGGRDAANEVNKRLLPYADVVFGVFDADTGLENFNEEMFASSASAMIDEFPNLKMAVSTLRTIRDAGRHDLGGVCFANGEITTAKPQMNIGVFDRVGSGDAFAAGFIYGMLAGKDMRFALDCGTALGTLAMTTAGDVAAVTADEVFALMKGGDAAAKR
jgi:2-dehydro-3-deoxygluconokinase